MKELLEIKRIVEEVFGVDDASAKTRKREFVDAKKAICYLGKSRTRTSYDALGRLLNLTTGSTQYHHKKSAPDLIDSDSGFREKIKDIDKILTNRGFN